MLTQVSVRRGTARNFIMSGHNNMKAHDYQKEILKSAAMYCCAMVGELSRLRRQCIFCRAGLHLWHFSLTTQFDLYLQNIWQKARNKEDIVQHILAISYSKRKMNRIYM